MAELTDEQIAQEEKFLKGLPPFYFGAFILPGIWGIGHGFWASLLFYPIWLVLDNLLYGAYRQPEWWTILLAVIAVVIYIAPCVAFGRVCQPLAAHKAEKKGLTREQYLKREKIWLVVCIILAIAALAWATYYNLTIRPNLQ